MYMIPLQIGNNLQMLMYCKINVVEQYSVLCEALECITKTEHRQERK